MLKMSVLRALMVSALCVAGRVSAVEAAYDPLKVGEPYTSAALGLTVHDGERKRDLPLRVYLPPGTNSAPVVFFSHGLGGSCDNNPYLGRHWAARGYVAVFVQHPGSDDTVWKNKPKGDRMGAMRDAAGVRNFSLRVKDIPAVLDQLEKWNKEADHALAGRLDLSRVGMSGHSFGAVTTQAVSGQKFALGLVNYTDTRIKAAVTFSPSAPRRGDASKAFGEVSIPWLLMTGTKDTSIVNDTDVTSRLSVFPALPAGNKYELVLEGAEHSAFGDRALPGDKEVRNPNHHRAILALSIAFWDAYLRGNAEAKAWLEGDGARSVLEPKDRWQRK
jgi:predicted dienelactone hydrolase